MSDKKRGGYIVSDNPLPTTRRKRVYTIPRTISTFGDVGEDREIDALHARIDALEQAAAIPKTIRIAQRIDPSSGAITVQDSSGTPSLLVSGIEFQTADGVTVTLDGDFALIAITNTAPPAPATTVTPVAAANVVGVLTTYAREDHVHEGVHSLTAGTNISVSAPDGDPTISVIGLGNASVNYTEMSGAGNTLVPGGQGNFYVFGNHQGSAKNVVCNGSDIFSDATTSKSVADQTASGWCSVSDGTRYVHFPIGGL